MTIIDFNEGKPGRFGPYEYGSKVVILDDDGEWMTIGKGHDGRWYLLGGATDSDWPPEALRPEPADSG